MKTDAVYIVICTVGEYSCREDTPIVAYASEAEAVKHAVDANAEATVWLQRVRAVRDQDAVDVVLERFAAEGSVLQGLGRPSPYAYFSVAGPVPFMEAK